MVPAIFLGVAAFLLNIVLSRLVATQREQIAVLKAFGYTTWTVGAHYLQLALVPVGVGAVLGTGVGLWLGWLINQMYVTFYRFPVFRYEPGLGVVALAIGVSGCAALVGAWHAVRRALVLPPAEAMRPEAPPTFHAGLLDRSGLQRWVAAPVRMILRNLLRRPSRAALSVLAMSFAIAILIVGRYFVDAVGYIADVQFRLVQRDDVTVALHDPAELRDALRTGAPAGRVAHGTVSGGAGAAAVRAPHATHGAGRAGTRYANCTGCSGVAWCASRCRPTAWC